MYKATVRDFVDIKKVNPNLPLESVVHIAKRLNNSKRDYLFVNNYLGKHIPMYPSRILQMYSLLYTEIYKVLKDMSNILVVSFAETATSIGEYIMLQGVEFNKPLNFVHYLQTTRETFESDLKLIDFAEEHSHAVNQSVYSNSKDIDFDCVLFVEDEITTGKTIRNFVKEFNKLRPYCDYFVASFLNWQNTEDRQAFEAEGIESICLISGKLKDNVPELTVKANEFHKLSFDKGKTYMINTSKNFTEHKNLRLGLCSYDYRYNLCNPLIECVKKALSFVGSDDIVEVIGTEEFMFLPLMCANVLESVLGENRIVYHATTRSPITTSYDLGYCMHEGLTLTSAYESLRETHLYNMSKDSNKIICITEKNADVNFLFELTEYAHQKNKKILFIEV